MNGAVMAASELKTKIVPSETSVMTAPSLISTVRAPMIVNKIAVGRRMRLIARRTFKIMVEYNGSFFVDENILGMSQMTAGLA